MADSRKFIILAVSVGSVVLLCLLVILLPLSFGYLDYYEVSFKSYHSYSHSMLFD